MNTSQSRKNLGFPEKEEWQKEPAHFTDESLFIAGHHVMDRWETKYMEKLSHIATQNGGHVLELGFGMGISAELIQKTKRAKTHTIIECHPEVAARCKEKYAQEIKDGKIILVEGFWEDVIDDLKDASYDGILFDTYPLTEEQVHKNHFWFFKDAYRLLKKGGVLTYYSDEEKNYSDEHLVKLHEAGFNHIGQHICKMYPPKNMYWNEKSMIAPEIIK
ncbi:hypothetical protein C0581_00170 [Candidatus Parcubacteria bacterium]|nr:MAG: hypothetical protein C0581_00170 [Candidatus Parcubacteria bacterium]